MNDIFFGLMLKCSRTRSIQNVWNLSCSPLLLYFYTIWLIEIKKKIEWRENIGREEHKVVAGVLKGSILQGKNKHG